MEYLKYRIYNLIREDDKNDFFSNIIDGFIIFLIIADIVSIIVDTDHKIRWLCNISIYLELISVFVFTLEYFLRIWTSTLMYPELRPFKARVKYIFSFMSIIDLISILTFYIAIFIPKHMGMIKSLRLARILRIFKLNRYTDSLKIIMNVFKRKLNQLISSMFITITLIVISSVLMYNIENKVQPEAFNDIPSGMWWVIITITTVGYGDIYPITPEGRLLGSIITFLGVTSIAIPTAIISAGFIEDSTEENQKIQDEKFFCPYCGHKLN